MSIVHSEGLPHEPKRSFTEIIEQKGIIPNSREVEALRLDYARALQIQEALRDYPPIASVRAMVNSGSTRDGSTNAGVTLFIIQRPGMKIDQRRLESSIENVIPGLSRGRISIEIHSERKTNGIGETEGVWNKKGRVIPVPLVPFLYFWKVPEDDYNRFALVLVFILLVAIAVGGVSGYWYCYYQQSKRFFEAELPDVRSKQLKIDRGNRDLTER